MDFSQITQMQIVAFVNGAFLTGTALLIGHYFPLPGKNGKLPTTVWNLIGRYTYGVMSIWLGVLVWLALLGHAIIALGILGICFVDGFCVAIAYWYDDYRDAKDMSQRSADDVRDINGKL